MLKKNQRVTRTNLTTLFSIRKAYHSPHFSLRIIAEDKEIAPRVAFVISKKVERLAISRNKAKRRCYHAFKKIFRQFNKPFMAVFIIRKKIQTIPFIELEREIQELCKKGGVV